MISAKLLAAVALLALAGAAVAYLLNFSGATDPATEAPQRVPLPEPPQARPVASMLDAVGDSDLAALRALYTPKVQDRISKKGWEEYAEMLSALLHHLYGDDFDDLSFAYSGNEDHGKVTLYVVGEARGSMRVARAGRAWLLDEW